MKKFLLSVSLQILLHAANAADYYWVNGSGNWSDFSNHWTTASGGNTFHQLAPQPLDNVFFDAGSFTAAGQVITLDVPQVFCNNFSWQNTAAGCGIAVSVSDHVNIYGSMSIGPNTDLLFYGTFSLLSASAATLNIQDTLSCILKFNNVAGAWTLLSPLNLTGTIRLDQGTFNTAGFTVTCYNFISNNGSAGRVLQTQGADMVIRSINYDYLFPMTYNGGTWEIDNLLSFGGSLFTLRFQFVESVDSAMQIYPQLFSRMRMQSGDQQYLHILCNAPDSINAASIESSLDIIAGDLQINTLISEECVISLNSDSLMADTVLCKSVRSLLPSYLFSSYNMMDVAYFEAPNLNFGIWDKSNLPEIKSAGCVFINGGLTFPPQGAVFSNIFGTVTAGGCFTYSCGYSQYYFPKCVIGGDGTFNSGCTFDTLMFTAGFSYSLASGDTVTVNEKFIATGDQQHPIQLHVQTPGTQAFMIFGDSVCLDYIYLQDISATGAYVNAGANSIDISNNNGWQFTACSLTSNVWPGDANYDLLVNNADLLPIGIAWGETGPVRPNSSIAFTAQPATDWVSYFSNAVNKKHADCDGNGTIDAADTLAVTANYGMTHLPVAPSGQKIQNGSVDLYLALPVTPVVPGSVISIPVMLGTPVVPADAIYGAAFSITCDPALVVPGSVTVDYAGSWLLASGNFLHLEKDFASAGTIDVALTRTDHIDVAGQGMIAMLSFTVAPNASGSFSLGIANPVIVQHDGAEIPVNTLNGVIVAGIFSPAVTLNTACYPNPFHSEAYLTFSNPEHETFILSITDGQGRMVKPFSNTSADRIIINREDLSNGMYFYELKNANGTKYGTGKLVIY